MITKGTAVARKWNAEGEYDDIGELGQWSCFGERALLRAELRYAGIMATSSELTWCASRAAATRDLLRGVDGR